jgi:hypothetical protein
MSDDQISEPDYPSESAPSQDNDITCPVCGAGEMQTDLPERHLSRPRCLQLLRILTTFSAIDDHAFPARLLRKLLRAGKATGKN